MNTFFKSIKNIVEPKIVDKGQTRCDITNYFGDKCYIKYYDAMLYFLGHVNGYVYIRKITLLYISVYILFLLCECQLVKLLSTRFYHQLFKLD